MTKAELIEKVCETNSKRDLSKAACEEIVDSVFDCLGQCVRKDKKFTYPGFGTFTVRKRKARKGRNPQTGEEINIAASKTVGFRPAPSLKNSL
jgi:DNA-binding protein HU-beta